MLFLTSWNDRVLRGQHDAPAIQGQRTKNSECGRGVEFLQRRIFAKNSANQEVHRVVALKQVVAWLLVNPRQRIAEESKSLPNVLGVSFGEPCDLKGRNQIRIRCRSGDVGLI